MSLFIHGAKSVHIEREFGFEQTPDILYDRSVGSGVYDPRGNTQRPDPVRGNRFGASREIAVAGPL